MSTPLVSIVIPVYNRQAYIRSCLESCVKQDYRPLEIIVIDDGSTDASCAVIQQFIKDHQHPDQVTFRYVYQEHRGAPHARNSGLDHASGEFVQLLDSDDMLAPAALTDKYAAFTDAYSVVFGDSIMVDHHGQYVRDFLHTGFPATTAVKYLGSRSILTSSLLFRKTCFDHIRFDPSMEVMQDRELCIRLLAAGFKFKYLQKIVEYHRLPGTDNISGETWVYTNPLRYIHAYAKILEHVSRLDHDTVNSVAQSTCHGLWKRGRELVRAGKCAEAQRYFAKAIAINAGRIPKSFFYRIAAGILSCVTIERIVQGYKLQRNRVYVKKVLSA